jgi:hypothetical protein
MLNRVNRCAMFADNSATVGRDNIAKNRAYAGIAGKIGSYENQAGVNRGWHKLHADRFTGMQTKAFTFMRPCQSMLSVGFSHD